MADKKTLTNWASQKKNWTGLMAKLSNQRARLAATELMKKARDHPDHLTSRDLRRLGEYYEMG